MLHRRLTRRGIGLAVPILTVCLAPKMALAGLVNATAQSAVRVIAGESFGDGVSEPNIIATDCSDGRFRLWDWTTGDTKRTIDIERLDPVYDKHIPGVAFSPDGQWLATANGVGNLRIWDMSRNCHTLNIRGHALGGSLGLTDLLRFTSDSQYLVSWSFGDHCLRKWDVKTGICMADHGLWRLPGMPQPRDLSLDDSKPPPVTLLVGFGLGCAFSPGADQFALATNAGNLHVFDVATGKETRTIKMGGAGLKSRPMALAWAPDGKQLAVRTPEGQLTAFDLVTGTTLFSIPWQETGGDIAFSADGRVLAASQGTSVAMVEMAGGRIRVQLDKLPAPVHRLAFSPDKRLLVTALEDTTVLVWDLKEVAARPR